MKSSLLIVLPLTGLWLGTAFAQDDKPAPPKDAPRAERKEGDRPPPAGERPAPPRREGDMGPPRREGGPMPPRGGEEGPRPPRGEGDFGPPRGEGFGPPPRRPDGPPGMGGPGDRGRGGFHHLEQDDPEMFAIMQKDHDLEKQAFDVAQRMRGAPKTEKEKLKAELTEAVKKHFDIRQERRTLQMKRVEDELKRLKDQIDARSKAREEIISRRVTELTGEESDLGF